MQGTVQAANGAGRRYVRFGSAKFAAEVLPEAAAAAVVAQARDISKNSVVSVLVQSTADGSADSYGEGALVRLLTFQVPSADFTT